MSDVLKSKFTLQSAANFHENHHKLYDRFFPYSTYHMTQYDYTTWQALTSIEGDEAIRQIAGQPSIAQAVLSRNEIARNPSMRPWLQYQADLRKRSWPRFPKEQSWFWTDTLLR